MRKTFLWGGLLCLTIVAAYYFSRTIDLSVIRHLKPFSILFIGVIGIAYWFESTLSRKVLLKGMGYNVSFGKLYLVETASLSAISTVPAKVGIPVRLFLYNKILAIPLSIATASTLIATSLGVSVGTIVSLLGIETIFSGYSSKGLWLLLFVLGTLAILVVFSNPRKVRPLLKRLPFERKTEKILQFGAKLQDGIKTTSKTSLIIVTALDFIRLLTRVFCLYIVLSDLGYSVRLLYLLYLQAMISIIGIISMLPVGIGVKDASLIALLMEVGISKDVAVVGALIDRALWTGIPFALGVISMNVLGVRHVEK